MIGDESNDGASEFGITVNLSSLSRTALITLSPMTPKEGSETATNSQDDQDLEIWLGVRDGTRNWLLTAA